MNHSLLSSTRRFFTTRGARLLRRVAGRRADQPGPRALRSPAIEPLESRIAPANFTINGTILTVDLQSQNEAVTFHTDGSMITASLTGGTVTGGGMGVMGVGSSTAIITSSSFTSINITDAAGIAGGAVHFVDSGASAYPQAFGVTLNNTGSGDITFAGASSFGQTLNLLTASGAVTSDAGSSLAVTGGGNLAITATGHDVLLHGGVSIAGTSAIAAKAIVADSASNNFAGALQLTGPAEATVLDNGNLTLAASSFAFGGLGLTSLIAATGNITQTGALTATSTGTLAFASTGGDITLGNTSNNIANTVADAFSVTGAHTVTFYNANNTQLGNETLGTGAFALTSTGSVTQKTGTGFQTGGAVAVTLDLNTQLNVTLNSASNHIVGAVTINETNAASVRDVSLRNLDDHATAPTGAPLTTAGDVRNLTLFFDHNGVALPGYNITGALNVTAGGDITQTAGSIVTGTTTATVLGDFQIALTNATNNFTGAVSFNSPQSTHGVSVVNSTDLLLGASNVGRGAFAATALTGNITENAAIMEAKGAPAATFTVTAGTSISLNNNGNDFTGPVTFMGAALTTANFHNSDFQAHFSDLSIPTSVTTLTEVLTHAAAVLPSLNLTTLTVNAQGIVQATGSSLTVSGQATFNANAFPLTLGSANSLASLTVSNTGRNDVTVNAGNSSITFAGTSALGTGRLSVTAGNIAETGLITQSITAPAGEVSFTVPGSGSISLTGANVIAGAFSASVGVAGSITVNDTGVPLTLGQVKTGTGGGAFSATDNFGGLTPGIVQAPGSVLTLTGAATFMSAANDVVLTGNNSFLGSVVFFAPNVTAVANAFNLGASSIVDSLDLRGGSITQTGPLHVGGDATFESTSSDITLTDTGNTFGGTLSLTTPANVMASVTAASITVGKIHVGGPLNLTSAGDIDTAAGGAIVQTAGTGALTFTTPAIDSVSLTGANHFLGMVNVPHSTDVTLNNLGDLTFAPTSAFTGDLEVTTTGALTLPSALNNLTQFGATAHLTTVASNILTHTGGISFTGTVNLAAGITLTAADSITFDGDVNPAGALTLDPGTGNVVALTHGTWNGLNNQSDSQLTILSTGADFIIGTGTGVPADFHMVSGTISMPGGGDFTVADHSALHLGAVAPAGMVTIDNGAGALVINGGLGVGFFATNDQLFKTGNGTVTLGADSQLLGTGLAAAAASPVLVSQSGVIAGHFANSFDASGHVHDFFAGSDIVTPIYGVNEVSVQSGGTLAGNGIATGTLPDGDHYTVTSSLKTMSGLVTTVDLSGHLDIVQRNMTVTTPSSLSITTTGGGDGLIPIGGLALHTIGSVSISAPAADFSGSLTTIGRLSSLTAHDLKGASADAPFVLAIGDTVTDSTTITAHVIQNASLSMNGVLSSLKAVSVANTVSISANKFGTITTTADAAGAGAGSTPDAGNFGANLTSSLATAGTVLSSAKIAGTLSGVWDLHGNVGSVTAAATDTWTLGTASGANIENGGQLLNVTTLTLGPVTDLTLNAGGAVKTLTTSDLLSSTITAGSFGTIKVAANAKLGLTGRIADSVITATASVGGTPTKGGVALAGLSTAGDFASSTLTLMDGNVTSIAVGGTVDQSTITGVQTVTGGNFKAITAGAWNASDLDANTITSLKITGNLATGLFGTFTNSSVTARNNLSSAGLGTFSTQSDVTGSTFDIKAGALTTFSVGGQLGSTSVLVEDINSGGGIGTIQAADWTSGDSIIARTIGTIASLGVKATAPHSPLLTGGMTGETIEAFVPDGTSGIGKLSTKGDVTGTTILAPAGIGSISIGRSATNDFIFADAADGGSTAGHIGSFTAGALSTTSISAQVIGSMKIIGSTLAENGVKTILPGDVTGSTIVAHNGQLAKTLFTSFSVSGSFTGSSLVAPSGITTASVAGSFTGSTLVTDNPASPALGSVHSLTVGEFVSSTFRGGSLGTFKAAGNTALGLLGNVSNSTIAATSAVTGTGGLQAIGTFTVNGDFSDSDLDAPSSVGTISVVGRLTSVTSGAEIQAGYAVGAKLGSLTAGALGTPGIGLTTDLVTQSLATLVLKGNTHRGFGGTSDAAFVDILGAGTNGVGLGTVTASGAVTGSLFRVSDGNVTSFTAARFISSDLLVGFTPPKADDLSATPAAAAWSVTNHSIGKFITTAVFSAADAADSAAFQDSNVVAALLGTVTLSGVNPASATSTSFGVAFRDSGGMPGTVKIDGSPTPLAQPSTIGQFVYLGLAG